MSRGTLLPVLALASLAVTGFATTPPEPPPPTNPGVKSTPGKASVTLQGLDCKIEPKVVVIDWGDDLAGPKEVTWERNTLDKNAKFSFDPNEPNKNLFPGLPGKFASASSKRASGKPAVEPPWNVDSDGDGVDESYLYKYSAKRTGIFGHSCDPDICIRKKSTGCGGA